MPKSRQRWVTRASISTNEPASSRSSMRSRAVSLPVLVLALDALGAAAGGGGGEASFELLAAIHRLRPSGARRAYRARRLRRRGRSTLRARDVNRFGASFQASGAELGESSGADAARALLPPRRGDRLRHAPRKQRRAAHRLASERPHRRIAAAGDLPRPHRVRCPPRSFPLATPGAAPLPRRRADLPAPGPGTGR